MKRAKQRQGEQPFKGLPRYVPEKDEVLWWDHDEEGMQ